MSLSTCAEEFDSASHNSRPALGRGLRIKKRRNVKKKRCMLTDSLRTRFDQDLYDAGEQVLDHDERYGYVVKDLLVYLINSADSEDTTLGRGQQRLRANVRFVRRKVNRRWVLAIHADVPAVTDGGPAGFLPELHAQANHREVQPGGGLRRDRLFRAARSEPVARRTLSE